MTASVHPALQLLIGFCTLLGVGVPLAGWFLMGDKRDAPARLWFLGLSVNAIGFLAVAALQRSSFITSSAMPIALVLMFEALRRERNDHATPWRWWLALFAAYTFLHAALEALGYRLTWGFMLTALSLSVGQSMLIWQIHSVTRGRPSRGLVVVVLGFVPALLVNVARLVSAMVQERGDHILSFDVLSNLSVLTVTIAVLTATIGYAGFMLEKAHRQHVADVELTTRAEERQRLAKAQAATLTDVVRQRDAMIMTNSRFSAVNSMVMFNSAIVHEMSQPLQALYSMLELHALRVEQTAPTLQKGVSDMQRMVDKMSATLTTLRSFMNDKDPAVERVHLVAMLNEIVPILESQAQRMQVSLKWIRHPGDDERVVMANRVLLERVLFNLVANALEAVTANTSESQPAESQDAKPVIELTVRGQVAHGAKHAVIRVRDKGPGFPEGVLNHYTQALNSTQPQGLSLSLARVMLESWGGHIKVWNMPQEEGGGACVELWIPDRIET